MKPVNKSYEDVGKLQIFGNDSNKNWIHEKKRMNSGDLQPISSESFIFISVIYEPRN
jgi:hypothetical protein